MKQAKSFTIWIVLSLSVLTSMMVLSALINHQPAAALGAQRAQRTGSPVPIETRLPPFGPSEIPCPTPTRGPTITPSGTMFATDGATWRRIFAQLPDKIGSYLVVKPNDEIFDQPTTLLMPMALEDAKGTILEVDVYVSSEENPYSSLINHPCRGMSAPVELLRSIGSEAYYVTNGAAAGIRYRNVRISVRNIPFSNPPGQKPTPVLSRDEMILVLQTFADWLRKAAP